MRTLHGSRCFKVKKVRVIILCSLPSRSLMSLLNIPHCSFPQVLSSPSGSLSRPSASTTSWEEASASPLAGVGCLAEWLSQLQTQVMSPTPPTSSAAWTRSTRRSTSPDSHLDFQCQDDATVISPTDPEGLPRSGASSSSKHTAASRVPSMFGPSSLWKPMAGHVLTNPHHFLTMYIWDVLSVTANRMKSFLNSRQRCLNHVFLLEQLKSYQGGNNLTRKLSRGPTTWQDMLKNALSDTASWQTRKWSNCTKSEALAWMIINSSRRNLNLLEKCLKFAHKLSSNACTWHELVCKIFQIFEKNFGMSAINATFSMNACKTMY